MPTRRFLYFRLLAPGAILVMTCSVQDFSDSPTLHFQMSTSLLLLPRVYNGEGECRTTLYVVKNEPKSSKASFKQLSDLC